MKKTHKRVLGCFSLVVVAAMTVFAATLPMPGASATTTFTDTITVEVISTSPDVNIRNFDSGKITTETPQEIEIQYSNVDTVTVTVKYVDEDGHETETVIKTYNPDGEPGNDTISYDLPGFGDYTIILHGEDEQGVSDEDTVTFRYVPIITDTEEDDTTGDIITTLEYQADVVCSADINVYLDNKLIAPPSPIHVSAPTKTVKIPLDDLESGSYKIITTAYDCPAPGEDPKPLPFPYEDGFDYEKTPVPDTGSFFAGLNIAKTDYLITGLIIFFAFGLLALYIVMKEKKTGKRR